ncbi:hypothetical protein SETIT_8G240600v2 [Setaria italica]|uniref:FAR1 domain-containing protein n=1 Tax=Setaria italica TaxID=4555 RepID=K3ZLE7_SETIT|nr:hypothetical protein SETIT_8G240600v2 [Setaria italica]
MGCRRILFEEAGPSAPSRDSADSPSPKRLEMNDMRVAVDVRNTEVPERSPPRSEPSQLGERDTIDFCIKVPEMLESSNTGFRTLPTQIGCQQGSNEDQTITTGRQGVVFSPPDTLNANQMIASEEEIPPQTHQNESMDPNMVPREGMSFHTEAEAKAFYMRYAQLAEFGVKMCNKKKFSRVMRCSYEGKGDFYKGDEALRVRNKTTMKTKCKAHLKFTRVYDSEGNEVDMIIEKANLFHNHLLHTPLKTKKMRSHKSTEPEAGMSTQKLVPITSRDIENM